MTRQCEHDMFVARIALHTQRHPGAVADIVRELVRHARKLHRLAESACNLPGEWTTKQDRAEKRAHDLVTKFFGSSAVPCFQRDPRGAEFKITFWAPGYESVDVAVPVY